MKTKNKAPLSEQIRQENSIKAGAYASVNSLWDLPSYARISLFLTIFYVALFPFYQYHYTTQGFHYFPLTQIVFLLFKYIADIQTALQVHATRYTLFSTSTISHFLWVPLILFLAQYVQVLVMHYMEQINQNPQVASLERAFMYATPRACVIGYWSLITAMLVLPLGILWSFSQQETLIIEFIFIDSPAAGWFLTSKLFRLLLLAILFLHQWLSYALFPCLALDNGTFGNAIIKTWHQLRRHSKYYIGATLGFSVMWGIASWACKPFLTNFFIPVTLNAITLSFITKTHQDDY